MQKLLRVGFLLAIVALAACGEQHRPATEVVSGSYPGLPSDAPSPIVHSGGVFAVWHGPTLELAIEGSGSCPTRPTKVTVTGASTIHIDTATDTNSSKGCTADLKPTTWDVAVPVEVQKGDPLTVSVADGSAFTVPRT